MAKRAQQESEEERVTSKSRLMMNLTSRVPSIVSSSTSSKLGKTWHGYQDSEKSVSVDDRSGKPEKTSWDILQKLSSSWRTSSRQKCAFRKVRRDDSQWIGETWDIRSPRRVKFWKFRHGQWRNRMCRQSKRPSAKEIEKIVERCRVRWRAFNNVGNVHGRNDKCGDTHAKELLNYSKFRQELWRSHVETDVRCHSEVGEQPGRT